MSGREVNGWGECVWCGEMLKPEDEDPTSDRCDFCRKWNDLAQIVIKRTFNANKKYKENEDSEKAKAYWWKKELTYKEIHQILIDALNLKKKLWGECY